MKTLPCPTCGRPADLSRENPDRPFCCARCRELDLAKWLDEDYRIPGPPVDPESLPFLPERADDVDN